MPSASPSIVEPTGLAKRPLGSVKILSSNALLFVVVRSIKSGCSEEWCRNAESNRGPTDYESVALPTELSRQGWHYSLVAVDGQTCSLSGQRPFRKRATV